MQRPSVFDDAEVVSCAVEQRCRTIGREVADVKGREVGGALVGAHGEVAHGRRARFAATAPCEAKERHKRRLQSGPTNIGP